MSNTLRQGLPALPDRMAHLPIDARGYPVPRFVATVNGAPDHRIADAAYLLEAINGRLCWICGARVEPPLCFLIGPSSAITRTSLEPPMHHECAMYAATACPFLLRPAAHRRVANLPADVRDPGEALDHHPHVMCLWQCDSYLLHRPGADGGFLFHLYPPTALQWLREGRSATSAQAHEAINRSGAALLERAATWDGPDERPRITAAIQRAHTLLLQA